MENESHPNLPSGEWEGFYCYGNSPEQHKMAIALTFQNGVVTGSGTDDVAPFTWKGKYDLDAMKVYMTKVYATHCIDYKGDIDENGIWGTWENSEAILDIRQRFSSNAQQRILRTFGAQISGGFHIWPKKQNADTVAKEALAESDILKEIYEEIQR